MNLQRALVSVTIVVLAAAVITAFALPRKQAPEPPRAAEQVPQKASEPPASLPSKPEKTAGKYERSEDVIYGRRDGMALTMDVFAPKTGGNGAGVIICVTSEYKSSRDFLDLLIPYVALFIDRGYVVYTVMHSSHPRFTVLDAVEDVHRAVRFIKTGAARYGVDQNRLGITGMSAGGQLALMMGCAGRVGDPKAKDPVEKASSKVAAVACYFPPTDFLNLDEERLKEFSASFDFREFDAASGKLVPVTPEKRKEIAEKLSPIHYPAKGAAPTFIMHGNFDKTVPLAQSERMIKKLQDGGVECKLIIKDGGGHLWWGIEKDIPLCADWFDQQLCGKK